MVMDTKELCDLANQSYKAIVSAGGDQIAEELGQQAYQAAQQACQAACGGPCSGAEQERPIICHVI